MRAAVAIVFTSLRDRFVFRSRLEAGVSVPLEEVGQRPTAFWIPAFESVGLGVSVELRILHRRRLRSWEVDGPLTMVAVSNVAPSAVRAIEADGV